MNVEMNSKQFLFKLCVLFVVSFNTMRAIEQVQSKLANAEESLIYNNAPVSRGISEPFIYKRAALSANSNVTSNAPIKKSFLLRLSPIPSIPISAFQGPDSVLVPILLYHRIDLSSTDSQYYVSPDKFEQQMKLLHDWGYTTITTELLIKSIEEGTELPLRPVLITFDDGHLNNYTTAFPIMQKYGFTGVLYIIGEYMGAEGYINVDQIKEMTSAGWEVGSHSMSHPDLTSLNRQQQINEIIQSREFLETKLGVPVLTFAYPFGESDGAVINLTYSAGYIAAMGLGSTHNQRTSNLFALQRRGVDGTRDLNLFASFLPWQGDAADLQIDNSITFQTNVTSP